ncbi:hydrogenase maturation protease [Leptolyngbya sp. FACHB-711]|uniref:hydrogenase maturation protease n=1 Tax=unclassified Leptolyngbya TaxID=2650499 RepID=UPI0016873FA8|nr:hydrogenase maturation protease [Leptolyngbya sp. FACHB-711]MBD1853052.1 hydrogenase maturation protease [Cyanobacteria bacterium FACHB-502]MBD2026104.1 hydrogenase maturation protease [Leptolyngbya sp. FACHB-711]
MLTIIGCGNLNRCDDAVGVIVAQRLQSFLNRYPRSDVGVFDCGTGETDVMVQARGSNTLIIIDACTTGSEPGAVFTMRGAELESLPEPGHSLHNFRWDHALAVGRKMMGKDFPKDITVYLIEADQLNLGLELSPVVKCAAAKVFDAIVESLPVMSYA